jgi:hypothetical protein
LTHTQLRAAQPPYRLYQAVFRNLADVQAHLASRLQHLFVDVQASRDFFAHAAISLHMMPCAKGYLLPPKEKARAANYESVH